MASKYIQKYPIPSDFPEVLHDFVRELLRDQPSDIYDYGAAYFKALQEDEAFDYGSKGKNIPPDRDSEPTLGNVYQMAEGVLPESEQEARNEHLSSKSAAYQPPTGDMTYIPKVR